MSDSPFAFRLSPFAEGGRVAPSSSPAALFVETITEVAALDALKP